MKCPQCNTTLREGLKFCTKCGNNLALNPPVSSGTPVRGRVSMPPELTASVDIHEKRIAQDPLNPDLYIAFGGLYRDYKYYEEALVQYQKAVNIDSSRSDAHRLSGQAYLALGNYERAKVSFEKALSSTPDQEAQTGLFLALKGMDKTEDAIAMGSGLLAGDGRHPELYRAMADLYLLRGKEDEAISMLTSLAALSPDREVHRELSGLYRKRNMPDEALLHAQKVLSLDPKDKDALLEAGIISREKGDLELAGQYLETLLGEDPGHAGARAWLALVYADKGDLARAAKTLDALPPNAPSSAKPEDRELIARAYGKMGEKALASGDTIKAKEYLKASLKYAKDPEVSSALASVLGKEADNAFARQDYQGASLLYERAADLDEAYRQKLSSTRRIIAGRMRKKAVMIGAPVLCVLLAVCAFFIWRHYTTGEVILSFCNADTEVEKLEIDGRAYKAEPQTIRLPMGEHKVFAKAKQGYKDDTSTYTLKGGEKKELYISLDRVEEAKPSTTAPNNIHRGIVQNDDTRKNLYVYHPDTGLEIRIPPAGRHELIVNNMPETIDARFEGTQKRTNYPVFRHEGRDFDFSVRIQDVSSTDSATSNVGKHRGVVVNENSRPLYVYHPDSGNLITVGAGQYIILNVNRIPDQVRGMYDKSSPRETSFNFKIHKKRGNYHGTMVEFGARVNDPRAGS